TALSGIHEKLGARMVPFAGYYMPLQYEGVTAEHHVVRNAVGVFDVSHMGEFKVSGPQAEEFLQKVTSNDVSKLVDGKVQYSCLPNDTGGIVDDLLIYRLSEGEYMLVVNASNITKDWEWLTKHNSFKATLTDESDDISLLAVQGPKAAEALQTLTDADLGNMKYYTFEKSVFAGIPDVIISATGYTGSGGFEIYFDNKHAEHIWQKVFEAGAEYGIKPIGLGARDTLRMEKGFCLYGNDIDDSTSPIEAGLGWITKFTKEFINREELEAQKSNGPVKKLVGFEMIDRGIPRQGYSILDESGNAIGRVTSGTQSPTLGKAIGMGYVSTDFSKPGSHIFIEVRNKSLKAEVVPLPFVK
ncbi:MAG: glycine cleavage system aminomethyltransferase GcvT, partial [Owenweeksia sp.]